jgi:TolB protein
MPHSTRSLMISILVAGACAAAIGGAQTPPAQPQPPSGAPPPSQQPTEIVLDLAGGTGLPPHLAVPDFIALGGDAEVAAVAKAIGPVLWDDLAYEREYDMIPRDTYATIPAARSAETIPFDRWRELGADGVVFGTVQKVGNAIRVEARLFRVGDRRQAFGKEYSGSAANPRLFAHTIADDIHLTQRQLNGVARTKIAFSSDRDGERAGGAFDNRAFKEVYIGDYDGANQRRVTVQRSLNISPVWSADGRAIAYTSYRRGYPNIFISHIYQGTMDEPTKGGTQNWLPVWSPDGSRISFVSNRDGNPEIYVMDRDGSNVRRLTRHPGIDSTPTWSPGGNEIAFTSDRTGSPQIWTMSADGVGSPRKLTAESYADRASWSPAPFNEIVYASRSGPGFDIKILDVATGQTRQLTFGEGTNESPCFAPNGRHFAFTSNRRGKVQIFSVARDGKDLRQLTTTGNNYYPNWSQ